MWEQKVVGRVLAIGLLATDVGETWVIEESLFTEIENWNFLMPKT